MSDFQLVGGTDAVEALAGAIRRIGSAAFRRDLLTAIADEALRMVQEEFFVSRDPYGNPWRPLKHPRARGAVAGPLLKTGRAERSLRRRVSFDGFTLKAVDYLGYHQKGTRTIPARPVFPTDTLPPAWLAAFDRIAEDAVNRALAASL